MTASAKSNSVTRKKNDIYFIKIKIHVRKNFRVRHARAVIKFWFTGSFDLHTHNKLVSLLVSCIKGRQVHHNMKGRPSILGHYNKCYWLQPLMIPYKQNANIMHVHCLHVQVRAHLYYFVWTFKQLKQNYISEILELKITILKLVSCGHTVAIRREMEQWRLPFIRALMQWSWSLPSI